MNEADQPKTTEAGARYTPDGDSFARRLSHRLQQPHGPVATAVYSRPYDRIEEVLAFLAKQEEAYLASGFEPSITRRLRRIPEFQKRTQEVSYHQGCLTSEERLERHLRLAGTNPVLIASGRTLPLEELGKLNIVLPRLDQERAPRIVIGLPNIPEYYDPILNSGVIPWATQVCPRLNCMDVKNFFKWQGFELEDTSDAALTRLLLFAHSAPQRLKLITRQAAALNLKELTPEMIEEIIVSVDSTGESRAAKRGRKGEGLPRISSQRSRGQTRFLYGQGEFGF